MNSDIRPYRGRAEDAASLIKVWNASMGSDFPMDARLWRQNVDDDPHHDPAGIFVATSGEQCTGFVVARIARVPMGLELPPDDRAWIGALAVHPDAQRAGLGTQLLRRAEAWLASRGIREVRLGGNPGHFFPGVPTSQEAAIAFFATRAYEPLGDPCFDLRADIRDFRVPAIIDRVLARNPSFRVSECTTRTVPGLLDFLEKTFPGRWLYETQLRLETERSPQDIQLLSIGNRVMGFAHTYDNRSRRLGPSVYWRALLGPAYGGLGPMGISPEVRKSGLGFALLCESVERLRNLGVEHMAIDWTVLTDFYGQAGFTPWKTYQPHARVL